MKMTGKTYINMWMQYLVSEDEVSCPKKSDTKLSNFGSVICFLGHIWWDNVEAQHFPFIQLQASRERMSFVTLRLHHKTTKKSPDMDF